MSSPLYPEPPESNDERQSFTVRLSKSDLELLKLIADVWNRMDRVKGVKRYRKWQPSSVIARLVEHGIQSFLAGVNLPLPTTEAEVEAFIQKCVVRLIESETNGTPGTK